MDRNAPGGCRSSGIVTGMAGMKKQTEMSAYEYVQVNKFIYQLYTKYGSGLEFEECLSIGYLEYAEVRRQLGDIYNKELLWLYSKDQIVAAFKKARKVRNEKYRLESSLSLNQSIGELKEPVYTILPSTRYNFADSVCLWYDLKQLDINYYHVLCGLYRGEDDWEIMEHLKITADDYFEWKCELREALETYMEEWMEKEK